MVSDLPVAQNRRHARPQDRYLAYFQAYTNTYDDVRTLEQLYRGALECDGVIGLSIWAVWTPTATSTSPVARRT